MQSSISDRIIHFEKQTGRVLGAVLAVPVAVVIVAQVILSCRR